MDNSRTAHCACESLTLTVKGEPEVVTICACRQCQLRTGSVYSAHAFFNQSGVTTSGASRAYTRSSDSGRKVTFHFCPGCGSTVFWEAEGRPGSIGIAYGTFSKGPELPEPIAAVWACEKPSWAPFPKDTPSFDRGRPVPLA